MINEKLSIQDTFKEAKSRLDGFITLACIGIAVFVPIAIGVYKYWERRPIFFKLPAFFVPLIIFLFYVRLRQLDSDDKLIRQVINSILIFAASLGLIYALNFSNEIDAKI